MSAAHANLLADDRKRECCKRVANVSLVLHLHLPVQDERDVSNTFATRSQHISKRGMQVHDERATAQLLPPADD